ncbi:MAG TPA: hypothetical protein VM934_07400 [Pyrinomonadaceae bacterium]|jgi:hypothetical protein|nr:hypothetical protein [Pyrinomonadaceae bacterium]
MRRIVLAFVLLLACCAVASADVVYLRDGRVVRGTVLGFIGGRFAVRVTTGTQAGGPTRGANDGGEIQFFRAREIERVEIEGRSLEEARFQTRTIEVALAPNWIDSGVELRRGERVSINASGTIVAGRSRITPDGLRTTDPNAPAPRSAEGVLIGAITDDPNAPVIEIGLSREFVADRDGRLYLTVNRSSYTDARGSFNVQVRTERDLSPRRTGATAANRNRDDEDDDVFGPDRTEPAPVRRRNPPAGGSDPFGTTDRDRDRDRGRDRSPREVTVDVPGNSQGTDTGVDVRAGDQVSISASGTIVAGQRAGQVSPAGKVGVFANPRYPFPSAGVGALLGVIRGTRGTAGDVFAVGNQLTFTAPADGRLFLLVNDDNYGDNSGNFTARIRVN